jgi:hypothetical protein
MQFTRALTFYSQNKEWFRKVLAPAAIQLVPIAGLAAACGWALEICRRVIRGSKDELPPLDLRRQLPDGFAVWGIGLAYLLPAAVLLGVGGILSAWIFPAGANTAPAAFNSYWWGIEFIAAALMLGGAMAAVAAIGRFADAGSFRAAFQIREIVSAVRSNPLAYLQVVLAWVPQGLLALLGIAICGAGLFFTTAYALGSGFHLAGQAHRLAAEKAASGSVPGRP